MEVSTEEKIKKAASEVFMKKGFAGTRTRDIAEAANINLALLHYYYRSKEKLFEIVMLEGVTKFAKEMFGHFNDETTTLQEKFEIITENQIEFSLNNTDIEIFLLSEIRKRPHILLQGLSCYGNLKNTVFYRQISERLSNSKNQLTNPMQIITSFMGLIAYPFISKDFMKEINGLKNDEFTTMMQERKKLIPIWIEAMLDQ
jgi:AcrR family transcriptional regulator